MGSYERTGDKKMHNEGVAQPGLTVMNCLDMADQKTPATQSKSDFIRSQPASLSPAEVVEKAKTAGLSLSKNLIYLVRQKDAEKSKKGTAKTPSEKAAKKSTSKTVALTKAASKKPAKKVTVASTKGTSKKSPSARKASKRTASTMSKADFVRASPGVSAKDLVAKALFEGIEISENHVYSVRSQDKKAASKKARASQQTTPKAVSTKPTTTSQKSTKPTTTKTPKVTTVSPKTSSSSVEELHKAAASELGLGRAIEVLQGERARVRGLMGG